MGDLINALNAQSGETGKGDAAPCVAHVVAPPRAVAFTTRGRDDGLSVESQDELAYALKNPGAGGRSNDRMIAHVVAPPRTNGGRGRVAYGFNFEQFSGTEGPISPCLTKTEHKGKTLVYDGPHVVAPPLCMAHGQGGAEIRVDGAPSLTCNHEAPIVFSDSGLNGQDAYTGRVLPVVQCVTGERTHALKAEGADGSEDGTGRGTPIVTSIGFYPTEGRDFPAFNELSPTVKVGSGGTSGNPPGVMSAMAVDTYNGTITGDVAVPLSTMGGAGNTGPSAMVNMAVRRLTPVECERLQGFPDEYTRIPWKGKPASECPDGPRYKALGNSMAVPCMYWIGWQIRKAMT